MSFEMRVRRVLGVMLLGCTFVACTFPSVEYETGCAVPTACENDVGVCTNKAEAAQNMCSMKCTMSCVDCSTDFDRAMTTCVALCETCSANNGCANATESCKALLGVP